MMRSPYRRGAVPSRWSPGDAWAGWTLVRILVDGPRAHDRQWLIECGCGYQARRYENELSTRGTKCVTCANNSNRSKVNDTKN